MLNVVYFVLIFCCMLVLLRSWRNKVVILIRAMRTFYATLYTESLHKLCVHSNAILLKTQ